MGIFDAAAWEAFRKDNNQAAETIEKLAIRVQQGWPDRNLKDHAKDLLNYIKSAEIADLVNELKKHEGRVGPQDLNNRYIVALWGLGVAQSAAGRVLGF